MATEAQYLAEFTNVSAMPFFRGWPSDKLRLIAAMALVVGGGGGGGGGSTSPADIGSGIDLSADINAIVSALNSIQLSAVRSAATPIAQTTLTIATGGTASYLIPANCRNLTICINSGSLVHFTEDGAAPSTNSCWFAGGSKEIWEANIPAGATLKLLAISAATISFQPRI